MYWEEVRALFGVTKKQVLRDAQQAEISSKSLEGGYFLSDEHECVNVKYAANRTGEFLTRFKPKRGSYR